MAKVFDERRAIFVPASSPHPDFTEYRVAWGYERWGDDSVPVEKTQMVYRGRVAGMLSPSFPDNTVDKKAVRLASDLLEEGYGSGSRKSKIVLVLSSVSTEQQSADEIVQSLMGEIGNFHVNMRPNKPFSVNISYRGQFPIEDQLCGFLYNVDLH